MPGPKRYTVRDPESGRTVTFAWNGDAPPTDDDMAEVFAAVPAGEPPLTRERRAPGAPSALDAGHHPDVARDMGMSPFSQAIGEAGETFGRWSNDNLPALASTGAALATGGASLPVAMGAAALAGGAGAAARQGMRRAAGEGQPMTGEALGLDIAKEGALSGLLAGAPRMAMGAARAAGPAIARNARGISTAVRSLPSMGLGAGIASGNVPMALASGAAGIAAHPSVIRGVGNLVSRVGNSPAVNAVANRVGVGGNTLRAGADAFRQALLDALGHEPQQP